MTFALRLCLALGLTFGELQERMTVEEFLLWRRFDAETALPDTRAEVHAALQAHTTASFAGKMLEKPLPMSHFMLFDRKPEEPKPESDPGEFFARI